MGVTLPAFAPAQESLFLTLGGRARDSLLPRPFLGDTMAADVLRATGYDLATFPPFRSESGDQRTKVFDIAVRAKRLDEVVRQFVAGHPDAVVLDLGAGLDTRMFRVDPPSTVDWYDIDFPEIIGIREQVVPRRANAHGIGAVLTDPDWLAGVPTDRPAVVVADGLIPFIAQPALVALLNRLTGHFPGGELATNSYTTLAVWTVKHVAAFAAIAGDVVNPGFNDPHAPESWVPGLELVEEIYLTRAPELVDMPLGARLAARMCAPSRTLSRTLGTTLLRYRF